MDETQFKEKILPVRPKLLAYARRLLGSMEDAEDIVQETLLKLWFMRRELPRYRQPSALAFVIAKNLSLNHIKSRKRRTENPELPAPVTASPEILWQEKEQHRQMMDMLMQLPGLQQAIIRMRHIEDKDVEEIAALTGSSPEAVRMSLSRARRRIKELFFKQHPHEGPVYITD